MKIVLSSLALAVFPALIAAEARPEEMTRHVYDRLASAAGLAHPPRLVIQQWRAGAANPGAYLRTVPGPIPRREIVIDDKLIQLCRAMKDEGDACLAYFLGHELAHFVNNDNWGPHFARQQLSNAISPARSVEIETQADRFGGFYAALAGYDSLSVAPQALKGLYDTYRIPSNLPGYLPLQARQDVPKLARQFLSGLLPLFDAGGLLMALGHYREAAVLFDSILDQFPSREIFNNAGVALASAYNPEISWLLDGSTRLPERAERAPTRGAGADPALAREHFEKAISLDRDYAVAHLNLGLLFRAMGDERAAGELKEAVRLAKGNTVIEAIARGEAPAVPVSVSSDLPKLDPSALLPGGRRPASFLPARAEPVVKLDNLSFFSGTKDRLSVFSVGPIGPEGKRLIAVLVLRVPEEWQGRLGPGREIHLFPEKATLYESLGALVGVRGALVYQVR